MWPDSVRGPATRHNERVLIVRRVPRAVAPVSAGLVTAETMTAVALAHTAAGGAPPDAVSLLALGALVYGAGLAVLGRGLSLRVAVPAMVALQILVHAWLTAFAAAHPTTGLGDSVHTAHASHADAAAALAESAWPLGLTPPMLAAHVVAGLVAALALALRRRAVAVLLAWRAPVAALPVPGRLPVPTPALRRRSRDQFALAPTRGPPALAVAA